MQQPKESFLSDNFVNSFRESAPVWEKNPLGELVCRRTYCRVKPNGEYESWRDIVKRVVNGCYTLQKNHVEGHGLGWDNIVGNFSAQEMFEKMYNMKFLPPGRGLWAMGTDITEKKSIFAALNNCGFTTTGDIIEKGSEPFRFLMDMSMLGVGVGFDLKGASGKCKIRNLQTSRQNIPVPPETTKYMNIYTEYLNNQIINLNNKIRDERAKCATQDADNDNFVIKALKADIEIYEWEKDYINHIDANTVTIYKIEDTREGWVNSTGAIIDSYIGAIKTTNTPNNIIFYYGNIRPPGQILKTFGGLSSGPEPLLDLHIMIRRLMHKQTTSDNPYVTETLITDIMNLIGKCVVAGNVRRSSEIVLGDPESTEFINLKNYEINPERAAWGWCSNNSIYATIGMDYTYLQDLIKNNGEPGLFWIDNVQKYSRMNGVVDNKDARAIGTNPCITADTRVLTADGYKPVKNLIDVQFEALVDGIPYKSTEKGFWSNGIKDIYLLKFSNGSELKITGDHEIYTSVGKVKAIDLTSDHLVITNFGPHVTLTDRNPHGREEVYDCTIEEVHCFIANRIKISNCSEQTLEDKELCCLVEVFIALHESKEEFLRTLKFAYLYAKTVTLGDSHWVATNRVMMRNRRIGCSLTGLVQFLAKNSIEVLRDWLDAGYAEIQRWDRIYSDWLAIPRSIKTTSIKPSGCLAGDTSVRVFDNHTGKTKNIDIGDIVEHGIDHDQYPLLAGTFYNPREDIFIFNKDNLPEKVTKLFFNGAAKMLQLQFEDGIVKCTPEHKFLVTDGDSTKWIKAQDLKAGDDIVSYGLIDNFN